MEHSKQNISNRTFHTKNFKQNISQRTFTQNISHQTFTQNISHRTHHTEPFTQNILHQTFHTEYSTEKFHIEPFTHKFHTEHFTHSHCSCAVASVRREPAGDWFSSVRVTSAITPSSCSRNCISSASFTSSNVSGRPLAILHVSDEVVKRLLRSRYDMLLRSCCYDNVVMITLLRSC